MLHTEAAMAENSLVKIIEPGLIQNETSYWAMHFCAVLEAMRQQNQLAFSFHRSIPEELPHTLANLVANTPTGFFALLKASVTNFGMQYFLAHYLVSYEGRVPLVALLNAIANAYDVDLVGSMISYEIHVCGADSRSGRAFLEGLNAVIFGYTDQTIQQAWEDVKHVDLCIVIHRAAPLPKLAILGEVEGNHGAQMLKSPYWSGTASFCAFGIGVVLSDRKNMELQTFRTPTGPKSVLTLSSTHYVVSDFKIAIDVLEVLFSMNHKQNIPLHLGMDTVVKMIRDYWNKPVDDLIAALRSLIVSHESMSVGADLIAIPSVPKIIL